MQQTIVIGFAEALSAPEVTWSLQDAGYKVIAFRRRGRRSALGASRGIQFFEITAPEDDFLKSLADLENNLSALYQSSDEPSALFPLDDPALALCSRVRLDEGIELLGPSGGAAEIALDKSKQVALAEASGFRLPETLYIESCKDVLVSEIPFPAVFKPANAVYVRGNRLCKGRGWICADPSELRLAVGEWDESQPMLLQRFITGTGSGLFGLATGRVVGGWSAHRRLRMMNPQGSGASACTPVAVNSDLVPIAGRFLKDAGWQGLFMFELLEDAEGQHWFVEFNGRPWGSMALARRQGFEYPAWSAKAVLRPNETIDFPDLYREPRPIICRHLGRELIHLAFVARGKGASGMKTWPSFWSTFCNVVRIGRNDRWYNWRANNCGVFFSDLWHTLRDFFIKR